MKMVRMVGSAVFSGDYETSSSTYALPTNPVRTPGSASTCFLIPLGVFCVCVDKTFKYINFTQR